MAELFLNSKWEVCGFAEDEWSLDRLKNAEQDLKEMDIETKIVSNDHGWVLYCRDSAEGDESLKVNEIFYPGEYNIDDVVVELSYKGIVYRGIIASFKRET